MSDAVQGNKHYLGSGEVYFDRFDGSGLSTGERFLGNVEDFTINVAVETSKKYSGASASKELVAEATKRTDADFTAVCDEWTKENIALFLRGAEGTFSQGSGTVAAGAPSQITAKLDRWVALPHRNVSSLVVKNSAQTTTYVLGTDYKADLVLGRVYFIEGGAIAADAVIKCEYTYSTVSIPQIAVGSTPLIRGKLRFKGFPSAGPTWDAEIWLCQIGGDGGLKMISEDHGTFQLKGTVLSDTVGHPSSPLGVWQQRVA